MDIHPSNNLHTCKMEHEDDSENDRADKMDIHPSNNLRTCKIKSDDDSESEIF